MESPNQTLEGFNDWINIVYDFRSSSDFADGIHLTTSEEPELSVQDAIEAGRRSDYDGDGISNVDDVCPNIFDASQTDTDHDGFGDTCDGEIGPPKDASWCTGNGWRKFNIPRAFKNQGDCIQFVNTGK